MQSVTYSPEDNKLRLYVGRVPRDEYERLRAAGFTSTPKQSCDFVATWTPAREDLALTFLAPVGRLVAICGTGPRRQPLFDRASQVIDLPPGSFRSEGTNAGASIVVFDQGR